MRAIEVDREFIRRRLDIAQKAESGFRIHKIVAKVHIAIRRNGGVDRS